MLHRVIYASEAVGMTGTSTLSIAQILGVSERNNRRDHLTSCVMFHQGHILQATEGGRADIDRFLRRVLADPRHTNLRIVSDRPIRARRLDEPMSLCTDSQTLLAQVGLSCISRLTANDADRMLELRTAA